MSINIHGASLLASLTWEKTDDTLNTWTARSQDRSLYYILSCEESHGSSLLDLTEFHPASGRLLHEWRWVLGSTFGILPDAPAEGTA